MKKILLVLFTVIIISVVCIYVIIPNDIVVSKIIYTNCRPVSVLRCLHDDTKWNEWFPGCSASANKLTYNNQQYILGKKDYSSINISILYNTNQYASLINILPIHKDSSVIQWQLQFAASNNPFKRIQQYERAKAIKNNFSILLDSFKHFIQTPKNIYGFTIKQTTLTDTALVSVKTNTKQYPSTQLIYSMVNELKIYIKQQHATEHNYPMLNITKLEDSNYEVMVGIPTNIPLTGTAAIRPKRMIMIKDKTLLTEVVGDTTMIKKAFEAMNNYMDDHELSPPVIPFQQLVTDRSKQKDSTKWVTRIFTPII